MVQQKLFSDLYLTKFLDTSAKPVKILYPFSMDFKEYLDISIYLFSSVVFSYGKMLPVNHPVH